MRIIKVTAERTTDHANNPQVSISEYGADGAIFYDVPLPIDEIEKRIDDEMDCEEEFRKVAHDVWVRK